MLCEQNLLNVLRKRAFLDLVADANSVGTSNASENILKCIDVFRERMDYAVERSVPMQVFFTQPQTS